MNLATKRRPAFIFTNDGLVRRRFSVSLGLIVLIMFHTHMNEMRYSVFNKTHEIWLKLVHKGLPKLKVLSNSQILPIQKYSNALLDMMNLADCNTLIGLQFMHDSNCVDNSIVKLAIQGFSTTVRF